MAYWLSVLTLRRIQTAKIADHPLAVYTLPIQRSFPSLLVECRPSFGVPPTVIAVAARLDEFKIFSIRNRCPPYPVILQIHQVSRLLVIVSEPSAAVAKLEQALFNLGHSTRRLASPDIRKRSCLRGPIEVAQQMLDVIDHQLLVLHFMF